MSTFLQVVELLLTSDDAKAEYADSPSSFLEGHGLGAFDSADIGDAMGHAADALPMPVARQLDLDQGLDSAARLDLEAQGLSLDRAPLGNGEFDEDLDGDEFDPYGADADVDFDIPTDQNGDPVDALDAPNTTESSELDDANTPEAIELSPDPIGNTTPGTTDFEANPDINSGDYLTDVPFDLDDQDTSAEVEELGHADSDLSAENIDDLDPTDDIAEDLDLFD